MTRTKRASTEGLDLYEGSGFGVGGTLSRQPPEPIFTDKDTLVMLDARSPANFDAMTKEINKVLKPPAISSKMPARKYTVIRRFFSNEPFEMDGYAHRRTRRALTPLAPDPLENMVFLAEKGFHLPLRPNTCQEITPNNFSRGWRGVSMKTALDQDLARLSVAAYEEVRDTQDAGKETTTEDTVQPMAQGTDTDTSDTPAADSVWFQPWEGCEQDYNMMVELFAPPDCKHVLSADGSSMLALSCVRKQIQVSMFAETPKHLGTKKISCGFSLQQAYILLQHPGMQRSSSSSWSCV